MGILDVPVVPQWMGNGFVAHGDSLTTTAGSNAFGDSWVLLAPLLSDQRLLYLGNTGVSGENSTQVAARISQPLAYKPQVVAIMVGTNDITQAVALSTYQANIRSMVAAIRAAKALPVLCSMLPRDTTTYLLTTLKWNRWLSTYAQQNNLPFLDFFTATVDKSTTTTGLWASGFDAGSSVHPTPAGHHAMATVAANTLTPWLPPYSPPSISMPVDTDNRLGNNPNLTSGASTPTNFTATGTTMTGYTEGFVTDTDFIGKAWEIDINSPSTATGDRELKTGTLTGWSVGDTMVVTCKCKIITSAMVTAAGSTAGFQILGFFTGAGTPTVRLLPGHTRVHAVGRIWIPFVIPASTTTVQLQFMNGNVGTGGRLQVRFGELTVFNLTTLGLTAGLA